MEEPLPAGILATLERLAAGNFELLPMAGLETHYVVARDGLVAMVERREDGAFGSSGNPGKLVPAGLALFLRRGDKHLFVWKGGEAEASLEEVSLARAFAADLQRALAG